MLTSWGQNALAACSSPSGVASQTRYDTSQNKLYYCNDTDWIEMGGGGGGGGSGLGIGQTWQNVSGSRTSGTTYRNTTGKPISVAVQILNSAGSQLQVSTNGSTWVTVLYGNPYSATVVVPDQHYYRVVGGYGSGTWSELR